jgi:hypothetical protein
MGAADAPAGAVTIGITYTGAADPLGLSGPHCPPFPSIVCQAGRRDDREENQAGRVEVVSYIACNTIHIGPRSSETILKIVSYNNAQSTCTMERSMLDPIGAEDDVMRIETIGKVSVGSSRMTTPTRMGARNVPSRLSCGEPLSPASTHHSHSKMNPTLPGGPPASAPIPKRANGVDLPLEHG